MLSDSLDEFERKRLIQEYYLMALHDLSVGTTIEQMRQTLYNFEKSENYLECAGIKKAIETTIFWTTNDLVRYIIDESQEDNRIQMTYGKDKDEN